MTFTETGRRWTRTSVVLPRDLVADLDRRAATATVSRSAVVRQALTQWLAEGEQRQSATRRRKNAPR